LKIYIIGICGTFMAGIALLARELGSEVTGSDAQVYPPMSTQLGDAGIQLHDGYAADSLPEDVKKQAFMRKVTLLEIDAPLEATEHRGIFGVPAFDFGVRDLDAVLTFRNLHNMTPTARASTNKAVFEALRSGGIYGVIDHTRRHMEPGEAQNWRRLDPVLVIEEIQAAGFVFESASDLHRRPGDGLDKEVGDESVKGRTDRFTLRFRKP